MQLAENMKSSEHRNIRPPETTTNTSTKYNNRNDDTFMVDSNDGMHAKCIRKTLMQLSIEDGGCTNS